MFRGRKMVVRRERFWMLRFCFMVVVCLRVWRLCLVLVERLWRWVVSFLVMLWRLVLSFERVRVVLGEVFGIEVLRILVNDLVVDVNLLVILDSMRYWCELVVSCCRFYCFSVVYVVLNVFCWFVKYLGLRVERKLVNSIRFE